MSDTLQVMFEDLDSVITFSPSSDDGNDGWLTTCEGSLVPSIGDNRNQKECSGNSIHETTAAGTEASFSFFGRAVTLYGDAQSSQYNVQVDGEDVQFNRDAGVLARITGLATKDHTLRLTVSNPSPSLSFDRAVFDAAIPGHLATANVSCTDRSKWSYNDNSGWKEHGNVWPGQTEVNQTVYSTGVRYDTGTLKFRGQAVYIYGVRASDHSWYSVSVDGVLRGKLDGRSKVLSVPRAILFFAAGLDPDVEHTLELRNDEQRYLDVEFASVLTSDQVPDRTPPQPVTTSAPASKPTSVSDGQAVNTSSDGQSGSTVSPNGASGSSSSTPLIIGSALGSAFFVLLVCLLILFILRRRRASRPRESVVASSSARSTAGLYLPDDSPSAFSPSQVSSSYATMPVRPFVTVAETLPPYSADTAGMSAAALAANRKGRR